MKRRNRIPAILVSLASIAACDRGWAQDDRLCELDYLVVRAIDDKPVMSWSDGVRISEGSTVRVRVAQGSYTSASLLVRKAGQGSCSDVAMEVAGTGSAVPSKPIHGVNIQINYVKKWYQGGSAWVGISPDGPRRLIPELLLNDPELIRVDTAARRNQLRVFKNGSEKYIDVSAPARLEGGSLIPANNDFYVRDTESLQTFTPRGEPQQIWLSISVPRDTIPATYTSHISFRRSASELARVPIQITVLPFVLPDPALEYSIFYRGQLLDDKGTVSSEYKTKQQYRAELRDMKRHGIRNPTIYQEFGNSQRLTDALKIRREEGFTDKRVYYLGLSAASATDRAKSQQLARNLEQLKNEFGLAGYTDLYLFAVDEAVGAAQRQQLASWAIVHDARLRVFATGRVGTYANVGHALDTLILAFEPNLEEVKLFQDVGKRVLTYAYPQSGPESPELFRRHYGVDLWAAGVDGAMPYAYMHSFGSSWNDFDHVEYRDHHFVYPTVNGVIGTLAWEGFHEAVEDVRYLTALENAVGHLETDGHCGPSRCREVSSAAKSYLEALRRNKGPYDLYEMRKDVIDLLLSVMADPRPALRSGQIASPATVVNKARK